MYDSDQQDDQNDNSADESDNGGGDNSGPAPAEAVANAAPEEVDAHRGMLGGVVQTLSGMGIDVDRLARQNGLPNADVGDMDASQLAQMTMTLAREHPEVVQQVAQRFPEAQGLLGMITGGGGDGQGGGGMLGGLLGRFGLG